MKNLELYQQGRASYDHIEFHLVRMYANFPACDSDQRAMAISFIIKHALALNVSHFAVASSCDEISLAGRKETPFPPVSGEIVEKFKLKMSSYRYLEREIKRHFCDKVDHES